jgi:hypothetical protein
MKTNQIGSTVSDSDQIGSIGFESLSDLAARVQIRLGTRVKGLRVLRGARGILLEGCAQNYYAKQLVLHSVMKETQLPIELNGIEVVGIVRD